MSRVSVDAGAFRMVLNMLTRAAERHGEPTLAEAAEELRRTAEVIDRPVPAPATVATEADARVAELEAELSAERKDHLCSKTQAHARIAALESQLTKSRLQAELWRKKDNHNFVTNVRPLNAEEFDAFVKVQPPTTAIDIEKVMALVDEYAEASHAERCDTIGIIGCEASKLRAQIRNLLMGKDLE